MVNYQRFIVSPIGEKLVYVGTQNPRDKKV